MDTCCLQDSFDTVDDAWQDKPKIEELRERQTGQRLVHFSHGSRSQNLPNAKHGWRCRQVQQWELRGKNLVRHNGGREATVKCRRLTDLIQDHGITER